MPVPWRPTNLVPSPGHPGGEARRRRGVAPGAIFRDTPALASTYAVSCCAMLCRARPKCCKLRREPDPRFSEGLAPDSPDRRQLASALTISAMR